MFTMFQGLSNRKETDNKTHNLFIYIYHTSHTKKERREGRRERSVLNRIVIEGLVR